MWRHIRARNAEDSWEWRGVGERMLFFVINIQYHFLIKIVYMCVNVFMCKLCCEKVREV